MPKSALENPYLIFFPIGAICGLLGISVWIMPLFSSSFYPVDMHKELMINGFILNFVVGFLFTAIPRFTETQFANSSEVFAAAFFSLNAAFYSLISKPDLHFLFSTLLVISIVAYALIRFKNRKRNPPPTFIFIGFGLGLWIFVNVSFFMLHSGYNIPIYVMSVIPGLYSNGIVMSLVLGVGGKLIPAILGSQDLMAPQKLSTDLVFLLIVFFSTYLAIDINDQRWTLLARSFVILYFALYYWRIYKLPKNKTYLARGVWLCAWCFVIGHLLKATWLQYPTDALHAVLISGFSLITFLISTRVVIAHSGFGIDLEKKHRAIILYSWLMIFAAGTRVFAPIIPRAYKHHLAYAAIVWLVAFLIWSRLLYKIARSPSPS